MFLQYECQVGTSKYMPPYVSVKVSNKKTSKQHFTPFWSSQDMSHSKQAPCYVVSLFSTHPLNLLQVDVFCFLAAAKVG